MILLSGANISIVRDGKEYVAIVQVGYTSKTAAAADPVRALGLAIMLQAGYTEESIPKNTNFIPKKGQTDFLSD